MLARDGSGVPLRDARWSELSRAHVGGSAPGPSLLGRKCKIYRRVRFSGFCFLIARRVARCENIDVYERKLTRRYLAILSRR